MSQHAQYQTQTANWNAAMITVINYTCAYATMVFQNVLSVNQVVSCPMLDLCFLGWTFELFSSFKCMCLVHCHQKQTISRCISSYFQHSEGQCDYLYINVNIQLQILVLQLALESCVTPKCCLKYFP